MTTINHEITDEVNFEIPEGVAGGDLLPYQLTPIYGNNEYGFTLSFTAEGVMGGTEPVTNTAITSSPDFANVSVIDSDSVRIEFDFTPFDESFNFTDLDTLKTGNTAQESVDISTVDSYNNNNKILVGWNIPEEDIANETTPVTGSFSFDLLTSYGSIPVTFTQDFYWSYEIGFAKFQTLQEQASLEPDQDYDFANPNTASADAISDTLGDDKYVFDESRIYNPEA